MLAQRGWTRLHRPAAPAASNMSINPMSGKMPQGASDPGRTPGSRQARLYEETSVRSVEKLGEVPDWLIYDIPRTVAGRAGKAAIAASVKNGSRCASPARTAENQRRQPGRRPQAEFVNWRWEPMKNLPQLIVPFKRRSHERVVKEFSRPRGLKTLASTGKPYRPNVGSRCSTRRAKS